MGQEGPTLTLVPLDPTACPDCGAPLDEITSGQPALLRHGGYGATIQQTIRYCLSCLYSLHVETLEVRPRDSLAR